MKITGTLTDLQRMPSSQAGNPRYRAVIDGQVVRTAPDSGIAYALPNYRNQGVTATVRMYYGHLTIEEIQA